MDRECNVCFEAKPLDQFPVDKTAKLGRRSICRVCYRAKQRDSWNRRKLDPVVKARVIEQRKAYDARRRHIPELYMKRRARTITNKAVYDGAIGHKLLIRLPCEVCGVKIVEAHHDDYSRPLEVRWLCKRHHIDHHLALAKVG